MATCSRCAPSSTAAATPSSGSRSGTRWARPQCSEAGSSSRRTSCLQPLDGRQLAWRGGHRLYRLGSHRICKRLRGRGHAGQQYDRLCSPMLLRLGEGTFADPQVPTPAWGDYSATTFDRDTDALLDDRGVGRLNVVGQRPAPGSIRSARPFSSAGSNRSNGFGGAGISRTKTIGPVRRAGRDPDAYHQCRTRYWKRPDYHQPHDPARLALRGCNAGV